MLKTLLSQVKEFKRASIATPLFMILEVIMEMIIPLMMASIIDDGVEAGNIRHIYVVGAWMLLAAVIGLLAGMGGGKYGAKASTGFARNLRQAMFENIQTYSFSNIDKYSTAGLVTRLTTDVTNLQNAYQMILRMCMRAPASLIVAMVMAFTINAQLASIYLVAVIVLGCLLFLIMNRATRYFREAFPKYDDLNASVQENVSAIRVVKAYVREDYESQKFQKASQNIYKIFLKAEGILSFNAPLMQFTVYGCILLLSWLGAKMIVGTSLTTGELMSLLTYCMNILMSLMMLSMVFVMISMSLASARRVCEVLNERSDLHNPEHPDTMVQDGSIQFDHVSFRYKQSEGEPVLQDINLSIHSGETVGIIGGTGSAKTSMVNLISRLYDVTEGAVYVGGKDVRTYDMEVLRNEVSVVGGTGSAKTSMVNLISRLYDVTEGAVYVGGKDVRTYDMEVLRNEVSVVLQKNVLFSGTILENLRWGDKEASEEECVRASKLACADEFIQKMPEKYNTFIEQGGTNVSGGQKQRLCIARALLKKPKILILDDSTSAVDTATDAKIRRAFAEEIPNTTKLIIAQRISSVQNADRIIVMDNGRVSGFGTHEQLLETNAIYREVYESQTGGGSGDFDEKGGEE